MRMKLSLKPTFKEEYFFDTDMDAATRFMAITGCKNINFAVDSIQRYGSLNDAVNAYFENNRYGNTNNTDSVTQIHPQIVALFQKYQDESNVEKMGIDGVIQYFTDLNIDFESDLRAMVTAYILESPKVGEFSKDKFVKYWSRIGVTDLDGMLKHLTELSQKEDVIKEVYKFTFRYSLEEGQKKLPLEDAVSLWNIFFQRDLQNPDTTAYKFIKEFIESGQSGKSDISRDEWSMAYVFFQIPISELESYDENAAWPVLMDEFVDMLFQRF